jgi:hypothetical protein
MPNMLATVFHGVNDIRVDSVPKRLGTCVSIRDLAGGKTGGKHGHSGMPGSFLKEPAP